MDGLLDNADIIDNVTEEVPKVVPQQTGGKESTKNKLGNWFKNNKVLLIIILILIVAVAITVIIAYFKLSSVGTIISCKEEVIDGLNKELGKVRSNLSKAENKINMLEKDNSKLKAMAVSIAQPPPQQQQPQQPSKSKNKQKRNIDQLDALVMNPSGNLKKKDGKESEKDEELDELPLNL